MSKKFFIAGCGGLGCYIVENLIRLVAEKIVVCDGDVFSASNLNRQLYCTADNLGKSKVECAKKRADELVFPGEFVAINEHITEDNIDKLLDDCEVVIDALDNTKARFILEDACKRKSLPLVHGAVADESYQVAVVMPGSDFLHRLYDGKEFGNKAPTYCFTVEACAAVQTAEAYKLVTNRKSNLENALLLADLSANSYEVIKI